MATHFSSTRSVRSIFQSKPNPSKSLLFLPDSYHRRTESATCRVGSVNVSKWSSAANYVRLVKFSGKSVAVKQLVHKRTRFVRCATIEEIEGEKSSIEKDVKARMDKTIEMVRTNFNSVRTGRANPAMLDKIEVEYYGTPVGLKSIAQITTPDASSLLVQPYDKSSVFILYPVNSCYLLHVVCFSLKAIEKAIVSSDVGLTPNNDGEVIRLTLPQLTSDRRKELSKVVAKQAEEGKVALRNIRRDALKAYEKLEKEKKLSEDNVKDLSSDLQKLTDEYMKKVESIYKQKEKVRFLLIKLMALDECLGVVCLKSGHVDMTRSLSVAKSC
ncbi:hypothetical protein Pint_03323 [Pistacia integerrima]|uniref:Uncharacterized protein n=1 Tax=Pistacia integerrima TaxID=434235 RepID=A0ACC0ZKN2_9ROSI|nr:hypothetical protein Pint_03323 [Pistacia integerrima]